MDKYVIHLDTPIGFQEDEITYDIEIITIMKTKEIITMYPVTVSDEFDQEGLSTSKELRAKRKGKTL